MTHKNLFKGLAAGAAGFIVFVVASNRKEAKEINDPPPEQLGTAATVTIKAIVEPDKSTTFIQDGISGGGFISDSGTLYPGRSWTNAEGHHIQEYVDRDKARQIRAEEAKEMDRVHQLYLEQNYPVLRILSKEPGSYLVSTGRVTNVTYSIGFINPLTMEQTELMTFPIGAPKGEK